MRRSTPPARSPGLPAGSLHPDAPVQDGAPEEPTALAHALERAAVAAAIGVAATPGARLGPYRLVRELGRGGMGIVYLAVRADDQYQKQVAIKLVKRGMDTDFILERFRTERQILARLDHPNIARLLDAGSTADGLPYYVMEYVEGVPMAAYCDDHELGIEERLRLFVQVCGAVHYAHQNLVIHRDLKPGNILVTPDGAPKLLDFGIAKLLDPALGPDAGGVTVTEQRLMTPEYASPEQVRGEPMTTASDVYALGVVLYELLTGRHPYRMTSRLPQDVARIVCEEEPARPSTVVAARRGQGNGDAPSRLFPIAAQSPTRLRRRLSGDLDTIVLKAMAKEPPRRYASVEQLAEDIDRHLAGRPVVARPDTVRYRFGKFVRRNRTAVIAAGVVLASLVAGVVGTAWQARVAGIERARAVARFNEVRTLANAFIFEVHDAIAPLPGSTPARALLARRALEYLDRLATEASGDPDLLREVAAGYQKLGDVQGRRLNPNLGDTAGGLASHRKALAIREALAVSRPDDLDLQRDLATSHARVGEMLMTMGDTSNADTELRTAVRQLEALDARRPDNARGRAELATAVDRLGAVIAVQGDTNTALTLYRRSASILKPLVEKDQGNVELRRQLAVAYQHTGNSLGNPNYQNLGDTKGAIAALGSAADLLVGMTRERPNDEPARRTLAVVRSNLSDVYEARGEHDAAYAAQQEALGLFERLLDADPANAHARRNVAISFSKLATIDRLRGRLEAATSVSERAIDILEALARTDPDSAATQDDLAAAYSVLGDVLIRRGQFARADDYFRPMLAIAQSVAQGDPSNVEGQYQLATAYGQMGDLASARAGSTKSVGEAAWPEARDWYQRSLAIFQVLERQGVLTGADAEQPARIAREVARCEAAMRQWGLTPPR